MRQAGLTGGSARMTFDNEHQHHRIHNRKYFAQRTATDLAAGTDRIDEHFRHYHYYTLTPGYHSGILGDGPADANGCHRVPGGNSPGTAFFWTVF